MNQGEDLRDEILELSLFQEWHQRNRGGNAAPSEEEVCRRETKRLTTECDR